MTKANISRADQRRKPLTPGPGPGGEPAPLLDYDGAAAILGISPRAVRELWSTRRLAGVKVGRRVRFTADDITEYVDRNRRPATH